MKEKLVSVVDLALKNKVTDMTAEIEQILSGKIQEKLSELKPQIASSIINNEDYETISEECSMKVRSEYTKHYADANKKGMTPTKATEYAYSKIEQEHGKDVLDSLKSHHDANMKEDLEEKHMTSSEKAKEKKLKAKYDPSEMKQKMIDQYGEKKGKAIYFATIRKKAMKEDSKIDESISIMTLKKHYNTLSADEFERNYGHPKHIVAKIFNWH